MSDVVLRCPNCGTTQAVQGECEACHEADVRYFCPNHTPGKWLDAPVCAFCGARIGGSRRVEPPAPPRRTTTQPPRAAPAPRPTPRRPAPPPVAEPPRPREAEWPGGDPWGGAREPAELEREEATAPPGWRVERPPTLRISPLPLLGCVGRLMMLAITALILLALGTCWFLGGGVVVVQRGDAGDGIDRSGVVSLAGHRATSR